MLLRGDVEHGQIVNVTHAESEKLLTFSPGGLIDGEESLEEVSTNG